MSSHTRALDATTHLTGELTMDIVFLMRRHPWHWAAVAVGAATGALLGFTVAQLVGHMTIFLTVSCAAVLAGLGINLGSDFRFLALTPSRVVLIASSRVIARPMRVIRAVTPSETSWSVTWPFLTLHVAGEQHVTSSANRVRIERMLRPPTVGS